MLFKFIRHALGVNAGGHEVMVHIAEYTDDLRGQGFIEDFNRFIYVAFIAFGYCAIFHLVNGALAYLLYISYKMWHKFLVGGRIIGSNRDKIAATQNRMSHAAKQDVPRLLLRASGQILGDTDTIAKGAKPSPTSVFPAGNKSAPPAARRARRSPSAGQRP